MTETMGCGPSNTAKIADTLEAAGNGILPHNDEVSSADPHKYPPSEAFEIPIEEVDEDKQNSLIKKHPPKRLKRLEETQPQQQTIEDLEEKLATAEIRRQQFLNQRVTSVAKPIRDRDKDDEEEEKGDDDDVKEKIDEKPEENAEEN